MLNKKSYLFLLPSLVFISLIGLSFVYVLLESLAYIPSMKMYSPSLNYYKQVLCSPEFLSSLKVSLYIALKSSSISVVIAIIFSILLVKNRKETKPFYRIPIIVPHMVLALMLIAMLSQNGFISRICYALNIIKDMSDFPLFIHNKDNNGLIIAYIWKQVPYVMSLIVVILKQIDLSYTEAARLLGASKFKSFVYVTLPLILPSVFMSFIIIFSHSFGAYELPFLIGSSINRPIQIETYRAFFHPNLMNRPVASVYSIIIFFMGTLFTLIYFYLFHYLEKRRRV